LGKNVGVNVGAIGSGYKRLSLTSIPLARVFLPLA